MKEVISMDALKTRALAHVARSLAAASLAPVLWMGTADAQMRVTGPALVARSFVPTRVLMAKLRPRHIPVRSFRADLRGDTAESSKYYKLTNITAEVDGNTGAAVAVNNDGRIAYNDAGDGNPLDPLPPPYIVNNGGSIAYLPFPNDTCVNQSSAAFALNESGEAVGTYACTDPWFYYQGYSAWTLIGATGAGNAYYDQRYNYAASDGSYEAAVNDHNVAVGCDGGCGVTSAPSGAALFEPAKSSSGRLVELRGLKGKQCYAAATGINDAGEIVGFDCNEAVRFSLNGYAEPLFAGNRNSAAEAINQRGDVAGYLGNGAAFLYRLGKTFALPLPAGDKGFTAYAYAINSTDEVVGDLFGSNGYADSAFVYINGHSYDLNALIPPNSGWTIVDAQGVNDRGEIVGAGYYNGNYYGISLKPPND